MANTHILLGTFQCGDKSKLISVVRESIKCGIYGFDTAPSYKTEALLGLALKKVCEELSISREQLYISDKIDAWQMRAKNGDIRTYIEEALKKLHTEYIDIMYVHWPVEEYIEKTWESLERCKADGLIRNTGICNVRVRHLQKWKSMGIVPKNIQIERHPLRTCKPEMDYCAANGITVFSYSPLGRMMTQIRESKVLQGLASKYQKNIGQIILRWQIDTNACPVFTSTKPERIKSNVDLLDFQLSESEIERIEALNINYKIFLESWGCPGF